jgi:holo-[acyl-carrier protein] synthase
MFETGIDIVDIHRIEKSITTYGHAFLKKIYHPLEVEYCSDKKGKFEHFAVRFAAKEAVRKVLLSRLSFNPSWTETYIVNEKDGKPTLKLSDRILKEIQFTHVSISLSHTRSHAIASVIMEFGERL